MGDRFSFVVDSRDAGVRVDVLLARRIPSLSRRRAARLCESGLVTLAERPLQKSAVIAEGQTIHVVLALDGLARPAPEIPLEIVLERADLLIVNKPAGVPCAAIPGRESGTLAGALLSRYPELESVGYSRADPGLVHRLDTHTSGLVLVARTSSSFERLVDELKGGRLDKRYLALVPAGSLPDTGVECSAPLRPDPRDSRRVEASPKGRPCRSVFRKVQGGQHVDLVEVLAPVAYRHQVRVHAAQLGAPLAGDPLYGDFLPELRPRHALHALTLRGSPEGMTPFDVTVPLPDELKRLL